MAQKRDYQGKPLEIRETLQRLAIRQPRGDNPDLVRRLENLPKTPLSAAQAARLPDFLAPETITCAYEDGQGVLWLGTREGLWRVNEKEPEPLDRVQCFRAAAYMLDNEVLAVYGDGGSGVYVLTATSVAHIAMKAMSAKEKAVFLSEVDMRYVQRRGMLSGARWDQKNGRWVGRESDNDGLWTSLVAMGDICRYAVLRDDPSATKEEIARAKETATRWTEAVLLLACIPSWKGKVASFVRYNKPGTNRASDEFLLEGREYKINLPDHGPVGCVVSKVGPARPEDWATQGMPEIVFRNVEGYIARSYHVNDPENDPVPFGDGVFFRKKFTPDGKLVSVRIPSTSDKGDDIPPLLTVDSSMEIPARLKKLYTDEVNPKTGKPWGDDDIIYKCDTSNDELVGHYAVWHLAYDILGPEDPELADIIKTVVRRHARHFTDNNYCHTDAGGQPTSWARMNREYYMNEYSDGFPDAPLGLSILLQLYKVAHHITGDEEWDREYRKLALEEPYRYADLLREHFERYRIIAKDLVEDENDEEEIFNRVVKIMNYSDVRMAAVSYYTLSQLETDPVLLEKYRQGADSWWELEKYARDIEWSLIYQVIHNEAEQFDGFGRSCLDMLRWQISRYPVNSREFLIDNATRPDAVEDEGFLFYPDSGKPYAVAMDERGSTGANFFQARQGHMGRHLHESYNIIMPYWIARYNKLLVEKGKDSGIPFEELFRVLDQA
ncbi:MAG TPA: hypothetical protein PL044_02530 [Clostridiales bacterium]|nr:MAG: hypothetical protein BWY37_00809 [Firmicutes bacterium ADurb.Bin262]HOU09099.1 hypothetical protein [Clostridiales bacterium]HQK72640.1 hypothetical protein [Clostridiales bacterium]